VREVELTGLHSTLWREHPWLLWLVGALLAAVAVLGAVAAVLAHRAEPFLRTRIVAALRDHFHARVELDSLHLRLGGGWRGPWGVWAEGQGLRIWTPGPEETAASPRSAAPLEPPFIRLASFRFHAPLRYRPGKPFHIAVVELTGLDVRIPPRSHFAHPAAAAERSSQAGGRPGSASASADPLSGLIVDSVESGPARLVMETSKPGRLPLEFAIARLRLTAVSTTGAMGFDVQLTNPKPTGLIDSTGSFGPLQTADPGESALSGDYSFDHADLASFKEIAGTLASTGHFEGTLRNLTVDGTAEVPDFRLTHFGNALPLHTRFHARVDGTNGDTRLEPVEATLGRSHFTAQGQIVRAAQPGALVESGHDIALTVYVDRGRIEDFLRLASHSTLPLLTGAVTVKTTLHIPPGGSQTSPPMHERLQLKGAFTLAEAQFASPRIQDRIRELSLRGQGRPKDVNNIDPASIQSAMEGNFLMANGVITLPDLKYTVPGAAIQLHGTYKVENGALDFTGIAQLQATVSQLVGGWAGLLLKPVNRFFQKDGAGTEIPIHIGGTRAAPEFEVQLGRSQRVPLTLPGEKP
jgi:hypothetical protein